MNKLLLKDKSEIEAREDREVCMKNCLRLGQFVTQRSTVVPFFLYCTRLYAAL